MAAALLQERLLECQVSLPQWLATYPPQRFQVGPGGLAGPARQELCIAQRFQVTNARWG